MIKYVDCIKCLKSLFYIIVMYLIEVKKKIAS